MITREQLFRQPEFWIERIQNDIFRAVRRYMEEHDLNQTQLADHLKVSKGYISQILNGNFNFSLTKLVDLCLALGVAPDVHLNDLNDFIEYEENRLSRMENSGMVVVKMSTNQLQEFRGQVA
jgi:transcriptional regulator with XRE-family HTH domain